MKRYGVLIAVIMIMAAYWAAGCGTAPEQEQKTAGIPESPVYKWGTVMGKTITVWGREADLERSYMTRAFRRYELLTGNTIKTAVFPSEEIEERVMEALGDQDSDLDLLLYYGGANLDAFDPEENFYDFSNADWVDDLTNVSVNQSIYHGRIIGLPHWEASVSGTLFNKKIFDRLKIAVPETQAEFMQACETLLQNGITPLYLPCASPTMMLYQFPLDTIVEKDDILEQLNQKRIGYGDLEEMHSVVNWYRTMAEKGYLGADYRQNDWNGMSGALESGKYAMMLCWDTWLYTDYRGNASDFGLMPAFMGVPERGTFEGPNLSLMLVNRNGKQVNAALDLISFMADPYNYNDAFEGIYTAPVFKKQVASISTPQYVEAANRIEESFHDSVAWLRIKGFSQSDASCILDCMSGEQADSVEECLRAMDELRCGRMLPEPEN